MSHKSQTFNDFAKVFKGKTFEKSVSIGSKLNGHYSKVNDFQNGIKTTFDEIAEKFLISENIIKVPDALRSLNIPLKKLHESILNLDVDDLNTIIDVFHEALDLVKLVLPQVYSMSVEDKNKLFHTLDSFEHLAYDIVELIDYGIGDDEHSYAEWAIPINKTVWDLTVQMQDLGMSAEVADTIRRAISPLLNIVILAMDVKKEDVASDDFYWDDEHFKVVAEKKDDVKPFDVYDRAFDTKTETIISNVTKKFEKITGEILKMPLVDEVSFEDEKLQDIWYFSIKRLRSLDWENFDDIHFALENIKENINKTLDFVIKKYLNTKETIKVRIFIDETVRVQVDDWFTLDPDFRTNNWVEVIHHIVKNIHKSLEDSMGRSVPDIVLQFIKKLDGILDLVDNENFKLLITPKEEIEMHVINLPDLLPKEPLEAPKQEIEESTDRKAIENKKKNEGKALPLKVEVGDQKKSDAEPAEENTDTKDERLTLDKVIDFLCFDKIHGATAKMDPILADVIHDLYYRDWLSYRLEHLEDEVMSIFTIEKYKPLWEDIKGKLLDENGVNLGDFITSVIEKVVGVVNELITFVKDMIQYVIDEIFNLVKAIIQFFEKVDLPADARNFLKTIPLFKDMPDDVTILHIIAAIPYTLYQEFISFEVPKSEAV